VGAGTRGKVGKAEVLGIVVNMVRNDRRGKRKKDGGCREKINRASDAQHLKSVLRFVVE
jgi:hypothetical protein